MGRRATDFQIALRKFDKLCMETGYPTDWAMEWMCKMFVKRGTPSSLEEDKLQYLKNLKEQREQG
jgi:hypothetical protein